MEFIWNVENYALKDCNLDNMLYLFSQEEMIQAIANYNDRIDILKQIELRKQFLEDSAKGLIKESKQWVNGDRCANHYNYASLKAWCKKHGVEEKWYFDDYGDWIYLDRSGISNWDGHSAYCQLDDSEERFNKYIVDIFYHTLVDLRDRERIWFNAHDEYTVEQNKLTKRCLYDMNTYTGFGMWSDGNVYYEDCNKTRKLTLEELKALNKFYDELEYKLNEFYNEVYKDFPLDKNNF